MKISNRIIALILATIMAFSGCIVASAAEDVDYTINNPYSTVDFDSWGQYKADLHCHTTASDGDADMDDMIEEHYAQGYDALALTDHGIVSKNWTSVYSRNYYKIVSLISNKKLLSGEILCKQPNGLDSVKNVCRQASHTAGRQQLNQRIMPTGREQECKGRSVIGPLIKVLL